MKKNITVKASLVRWNTRKIGIREKYKSYGNNA